MTSGAVDRLSLLLLLAAIAVVAAILLRNAPKFALVLWLVSVGFVPIWFGLNVGFYFTPAALVGGLVLVALAPYSGQRMTMVDWGVLSLVVACIAPVAVGGSTVTSLFVVITGWGVAFLLGRLLPARLSLTWIYSCASVVFTVIAVLSLIEFVLNWNPYVEFHVANELYQAWGDLQERGGLMRTEWAFGHSIALGGSLAMVIPLALASGFRFRTRAIMVTVMLLAILTTFSRTSIICAGLSLVLSMWTLQLELSTRARAAIAAAAAAVAVATIPFMTGVFSAAGSEATNSASYRGKLTSLIGDISILGFSTSAFRDPSGDLRFGRFQSIDSALLLAGLTYGWLALILICILLVIAVAAVVARRATAPTTALVAQIPAFATVALITQYSMVVWFIGGLAVASQALRPAPGNRSKSLSSPDWVQDDRGIPDPETQSMQRGGVHATP